MTLTPEQVEEIKEQLMNLEPEEQQKKLREILSKFSPEEREQLVGKQECPFCLMVAGKIPVKTVYEDDKVLAILDINPANKGHTLLFPKEHASLLNQVPEKDIQHLFSIANKIATAVFEATKAEGTNIFVANGAAAGQTSPHTLINIIPRFAKDKVSMAWEHKKIEEKEMETIAASITKNIPKEKPKEEHKTKHLSHKEDEQRIP